MFGGSSRKAWRPFNLFGHHGRMKKGPAGGDAQAFGFNSLSRAARQTRFRTRTIWRPQCWQMER
jgi:hypothetical protein